MPFEMDSTISIHAPREGGDECSGYVFPDHKPFQSTPPARGATLLRWMVICLMIFQSTPPARGATMV